MERKKAGRGCEVKTWHGKSLPVWAPPGETHCLQNKQCNEKDKGGLRSGRRHGMTHKHAQPHPSPSWSPSLTFSAPSFESPPPYRQPGPRRAAHGSCSSSGACRTAHNCPSRGQTASPHSSHICEEAQNKNNSTKVSLLCTPESQLCAWMHVADEIQLP